MKTYQEHQGQFNAINGGAYLEAKMAGFSFVNATKQYDEKLKKKNSILEDFGEEKPKPFKVILSFICIGIALILGYIEGQNVKSSIIGLGNLDDTSAIVLGTCFACIGLICGELLGSIKRDKFSNKWSPKAKWFVGLFLTIIYVSGQYFLSSRAGIGASEDLQATIDTMKFFILGISIIEVLFGAIFLRNAIQMLTFYFSNIQIKMAIKRMDKTSRRTEEKWQKFTFALAPNTNSETLETPAIKKAREYFNNAGDLSIINPDVVISNEVNTEN